MTRMIVYVDMDNTLVDFASGISRITKEQAKEYEGRLDEVPGIFALMDPMPGALISYQWIAENHDAYILSTAPWNNPSAWSDKLEWVKKHLGQVAYKRLILSHHKHLNKGDILIDDRVKNGAGEFEGELILFGSSMFPDWNSVTNHLRTSQVQES